jgi:hypothetical protein
MPSISVGSVKCARPHELCRATQGQKGSGKRSLWMVCRPTAIWRSSPGTRPSTRLGDRSTRLSGPSQRPSRNWKMTSRCRICPIHFASDLPHDPVQSRVYSGVARRGGGLRKLTRAIEPESGGLSMPWAYGWTAV